MSLRTFSLPSPSGLKENEGRYYLMQRGVGKKKNKKIETKKF
jgi:hypothetical protein